MNDYQKAKEQLQESYLVSASAGTGKTRVLVERYINILLQNPADLEGIVAITFTEKAAAEMKARIRQMIRRINDPALDISVILDQLNTAPISTIHSFCMRLLQEQIQAVGMDPQFRVIDAIEESLLRKEILEVFLDQNLQAADSPIQALLKHFDLYQLREMLDAVWQKRADWLFMLEAVSRKSAKELIQDFRVKHHDYSLLVLKEGFGSPEAQENLKLLNSYQARDPDDSLQRSKTTILKVIQQIEADQIPTELWDNSLHQAFGLNNKGQKSNWGAELEDLRAAFRNLHDVWLVTREQLFPFHEKIEDQNAILLLEFSDLARRWLHNYRQELFERGLIDFSGLELETEAFFRSGSSAAQQCARRFSHLLVDEFQDVSPIQNRIFEAIQGLNPALITFYVGDEKQSIYRFRGAEVEIFNNYKNSKPLLYLDTNYRSIKQLIEFQNRFFDFLLNRQSSTAKFEVGYDKPIKAADSTAVDWVPVELVFVNQDEVEESEEEQTSERSTEFSTIEAEVIAIIQKLRKLHGQPLIKDRQGSLRQANWRDFTILLRARTHQAVFEKNLRLAGIPYYVAAGIGFYQRREVLDVINFLRVLLNWQDEIALVATLRSPMVGLSDRALMSFTTDDGLMAGVKLILNNDPTHLGRISAGDLRQFQRFYDLYCKLCDQLAELTTAELIQKILDETGYLTILSAFPEEQQALANVFKLVDLALEWSTSQDIGPVDYLRRVRLFQAMQIREGEANLSSEIEDSITLMTIHSAKGLAFPIAVVPWLNTPLRNDHDLVLTHYPNEFACSLKTAFQSEQSFIYNYLAQLEKERILAEEKRLLYVAATRAESYLIFSAAAGSRRSKNSLWQSISPFFEGQPENLLHKEEFSQTEIAAIYRSLGSITTPPIQILPDEIKDLISRRVQPLPSHSRLDNITATAYSKWISSQTGEQLRYEESAQLIETQSLQRKTLSALELGTVIHHACSWWDFKDLATLLGYAGRLLKPYLLDAQEEQEILSLVKDWGMRLIDSENPLFKYIHNAVEVSREVDIYGYFFDTLLEGKIDLLLKMADAQYIIVDFKSDQIGEYPSKALVAKYNAQLDLYVLMLSRWSGCRVKQSCLYFIRNGLLIERKVTEDNLRLTEKQLQRMLSDLKSETR